MEANYCLWQILWKIITNLKLEIGYEEIEIYVTITTGIAGTNDYFYIGNNRTLSSIVADKERLESAIETLAKKEYGNRTVKYYSTKSYLEIALDFGYEGSSNSDASDYVYQNLPDLYNDLQEYSDLNSYYTEFRTGKQFKCTYVEYSERNGRITEMYYEEI